MSNSYEFGQLRFSVKGLGLFIGQPRVRELVAKLDADQLKEANRAAWLMRKASERAMQRYCNITIHGHTSYESAQLNYSVAKAVCDATWARMARL